MLDNPVNIKELLHTQAITGRAGASRIVKREQSWLQFIEAVVTDWTGKLWPKNLVGLVLFHIANGRQDPRPMSVPSQRTRQGAGLYPL